MGHKFDFAFRTLYMEDLLVRI